MDGKVNKEHQHFRDNNIIVTEENNVIGLDNFEKKYSMKDNVSIIETNPAKQLIYGIEDIPPIHISVICALQQALLSLSGQLIVSLLVADVVCASNDGDIKAKLLSTTLFMSGVTTVCMTSIGVRLPLFQGAAGVYIVPLIMMGGTGTYCGGENQVTGFVNQSLDAELEEDRIATIYDNIRSLQGSLMIAGLIHALVGATGLVGFLLRFIGPMTIVPALMLMFIFFVSATLKFIATSWIISISTVMVAIIMSLYLSKHNTPVPIWTPSKGFRIIRYPVHQVFAILISVLINWGLCGILTSTGVFTEDPNDIEYNARTDARANIIQENPWFFFPYPGQYGQFGYSTAALIGFLVATLMSILDSVGDYYACARVSRVPGPPPHAVNRGILIEGVCTCLSGMVGCGHATSTYGGNIGAVGLTKVASRRVFLLVGLIYVLFGIFSKFSAIFITIPYPVLGGAIIVMFGIFFGIVVSNLQVVKLSSPRNAAVLGLSVFIGLLVPTWIKKTKHPINTGNETFDSIAGMLLGNPNLVGTILACFLDNTVPGTREERGIASWQAGENEDSTALDPTLYEAGYEVYMPLLPKRWLQWKIVKYIPFLPFTRGKGQHI